MEGRYGHPKFSLAARSCVPEPNTGLAGEIQIRSGMGLRSGALFRGETCGGGRDRNNSYREDQ